MSITEDVIYNKTQELTLPELETLPIFYFHKEKNKTTKLVEDDPEPLKVTNRNHEFELTRPVFISHIIIHTTNVSSFANFKITYFDCLKNESITVSSRKSPNSENFKFLINTLTSKFSFSPGVTFGSKKYIDKVGVHGYKEKTFLKAIEQLSSAEEFTENLEGDLYNLKTEEEQVTNSIKTLEQKLAILEEKKESIKNNLEIEIEKYNKATEERSNSELTLKKLKEDESDLKSRAGILEDTISESQSKLSQSNSDIAKSESTLKSLKDNINLFPTELSGFVDQSTNNIKSYLKYSIIPASLLIIVTIALFLNAADLTTIYKEEENIDVFTIFLTRLPYLLIAIAIIQASYRLANFFIQEIIKINQQKLSLFKISIIATDISKAAEHGINLSDRERLNKRHEFKMELLREHMKNYFEPSYKYTNAATINENKSTENSTVNSDENISNEERL